ncbi:glycosyltransferase family 4 protein [Deferribacter abyssi]|uniref:glycosyltransferase family 4 protein n=1 Tax=Deferribacter abyssi TaxID=213806 RepID=UPI003C1C9A9C
MNYSSKNKIIIFIRTFSRYGGVENFCFRFYNYLKGKNINVNIICGENKTDIKNEDIIEVKLWKLGRFLKTLSFYLKSQKYIKFIDKNSVTLACGKIAHCDFYRTGSSSHIDFLVKSSAGYPPLKFIIKAIKRALNPVNYLNPILESKIYNSKYTKKIIAISTLVENELNNRFKLPENKIVVIPNGIDKTKFSLKNKEKLKNTLKNKLALDESKIIIGFCSTNFELKGLRFLISSLQFLPKNFVLLVAGGRNPSKYIKLAKKLDVNKRVFFLGKVDNMPEFYASLDVFCHPSFYDTFGSVVAEAIAMHIPTITTKNVGAKDLIIEGVNGYILEKINEKLIAEMIQKCINLKPENFIDTTLSDDEVFQKYLDVLLDENFNNSTVSNR